MKYSEKTYLAIKKQAVETVIEWFIHSDTPPPRNWTMADPWKSAVKAVQEAGESN